MKERIYKNLKQVMAFVLAFVIIMSGIQMQEISVQAESTTDRLPICCYTLSGRVTTYRTETCTSYSGYIDSSDLTKILKFYPEYGSVKVSYPTARGTKEAYAKMSAFFSDTSFSTMTGQTGKKQTAYRRSTGSAAIGSVYAADSCIVTGTANGRTQVIYPVDGGGYKLGWINGTYNFNSTSGNAALSAGSKYVDIGFHSVYYANTNPDLKAIFGYDYNKLLNHWITLGLAEGRSASPIFDPVYYLKVNTDVAAVHGASNYKAAWQHFVEHGLNEMRASSIYYDGAYYKNTQGDLSSFGCYERALHYLNFGIGEKRWANSAGHVPDDMAKDSSVITPSETQQNLDSNTTSARQQLVNYALSQIGTGDYQGNNNVVYNTWYWGRTINGSGYAWCQAFVSYCADQCSLLDAYIPRTAACQTAVNWYKNKGWFYKSQYYGGNYVPREGDIVFYTENGSSWSSHVGIIIAGPVDGYLQVVEGNVACTDGNYKVVRFTNNSKRKVNSSYVMGYGVSPY